MVRLRLGTTTKQKHTKKKASPKPKAEAVDWDNVDVNGGEPVVRARGFTTEDNDNNDEDSLYSPEGEVEEDVTFDVKTKGKAGRKPITTKISLRQMEEAIRVSNGYVTRAAGLLGMPLITLQTYIKKNNKLREALFETRSEFVDLAEDSLRTLVKDKNLTATIFTLKCLGQDRGYVDAPKMDKASNAPIIIKLMPADASVKMPKLPDLKAIATGEKKGRGKVLRLPDQLNDDYDNIIDAEVVDG